MIRCLHRLRTMPLQTIWPRQILSWHRGVKHQGLGPSPSLRRRRQDVARCWENKGRVRAHQARSSPMLRHAGLAHESPAWPVGPIGLRPARP